jgi:hypothetical protein
MPVPTAIVKAQETFRYTFGQARNGEISCEIEKLIVSIALVDAIQNSIPIMTTALQGTSLSLG